ncbi:hypothetical protein DBV14_25015 [Variovorax sp. KBW07]|nr:hypothetical protein DBV14_25015 [Variovorax sp. KBW07]
MHMPHRDYSEDDDFYTQDFESPGKVSIWLGYSQDADQLIDVLQDLCGVGYYSLDDQEANCFSFELTKVERLLEEISYSGSFAATAVKVAERRKLSEARWVTVQFDFAYAPEKVKRPIADDPIFLGVFRYSKE